MHWILYNGSKITNVFSSLLSEIKLELEALPIGGLFSFENFSRASQSLIVAKAKILSQYHLFSDT